MAKKKIELEKTEIIKKSVKSFLNNELKEYAKYVIETRALPNIMDGLRVGARKVVYAALKSSELTRGSKIKMNSLVGKTLDLQYHHGNTSLEGTIVQLASSHRFNTPPLTVIGQIGSLRVPDSSTAARYLSIKASPFLEMFGKDIELTIEQEDEGIKIEPKFLLPIIPVCLMQRTSNPGFGFSFKGFSFNIHDVIDATMKAVITGTCNDMGDLSIIRPSVEGIKDENFIYNSSHDVWFNVGEYSVDENANMIRVTDLPFNVSYESFEENLQNQIEKGYITGFENHSTDGKIDYRIYFPIGRLKMIMLNNRWKFFRSLLLFTKVPKLTLNCIDESGTKIIEFETPNQLVDAFVAKRLKFYTLRKNKTIKLIQDRIALLEERNLFIQLVIDGKIVVMKRKTSEIHKDLDRYSISYEVLKLPISRLTEEEIKKGIAEIKEQKKNLEYIINTSEKEMFANDLFELKNKLTPIKDMRDVL